VPEVPRPVYREPLPIRVGPLVTGILGGTAWMMLGGLLATSAGAYVWTTIAAAVLAWVVAVVLVRFGERGAAVGLAISAGFGLTVAIAVLTLRWASGDWLLW
jgi:hypothetical protein